MVCSDCKADIPTYEGHITAGFVKPTPARVDGKQSAEEKAALDFTQGPLGMTATAIERPVCAACYLKEFARVNPGAELPVMPKEVR
jgi:hypothetical protein